MQPFGGEIAWGGHVVLVHGDEHERRLGVVAWARAGLRSGAKVLYIEPPSEPADRSFLRLLAAHRVDVGRAVEGGQLEVFTADSGTYDPHWQAAVVDTALASGYPDVRWSGEAVTAWGVMPPTVHADVEWATDELCRSMPVSVVCQYPATLPRAGLQTVCAMHGDGVRESQMQVFPTADGLALAGAVDASNERVLRAALLAAAPPGERDLLVVDVRRLDFLDVAGTRAFLTGTTPHRLEGGTVCLRGAHGTVDRILRLLGVDLADGFWLESHPL